MRQVNLLLCALLIYACVVKLQAQHHHAATGILLDFETPSASSSSDSPIVCHGDSLNNNFHRNQHPVKVITEDADLFIGALLNVHESAPSAGFFSCGNITSSGLIAYEALNWISSTINQEHGMINGKPVVESFIPGVKIGIRAYDSCGHEELSKIHLMDMFPILETGSPRSCSSIEESSGEPELKIPGVIDVTGVIHDPQVSEVTRKHFIPILPMNMRSALPPEVVAKILHQIMRDLNWTRIAIIHATDEHSTHVVKLLGQKTLNTNICFTSVDSLVDDVNSSGSNRRVSSRSYEEIQKKAFESIVSKISSKDTPIFVIGSGHSVGTFSRIIMREWKQSSQFQWLFSSLPDPSILSMMKVSATPTESNIYALAPFPGKFAKFEEYWKMLQSSGPIQFASWFDEYICQIREPGSCDMIHGIPIDRTLDESEGEILWRTYQVMPIIHSIFTFSHAIRNAWLDQCNGVRGLCPALRGMRREEFIQRFLEPLLDPENNNMSATSGRDSRSDREKDRSDSRGAGIGKLNWKLAFTSFFMHPMHGLQFQQHVLYDSFSNEATILIKETSVKPSTCSDGQECNNCVKIRQSRMEEVETSVTVTQSNLVQSEECNRIKCASCFDNVPSSVSGAKSSSSSLSFDQSSQSQGSASVKPELGSNFRRTWGIVTSTSSGIGLLCVILCGLYFLMVFPVRVGTTIIGYMILFGLLILYSVNFLFVLPPTVSICWLRRIGMSLGYCTILAGMLVKVMNTWRRQSYKQNQTDPVHVQAQLTSPSGLLFIASGLVTVHLTVTLVWLYLFPPKPSLTDGVWRCYPNQSFLIDTESAVSLLYIILLVFLIAFFSILTWKSYDNNRETRFIFYSCSIITIIWITWFVFSYKSTISSGRSRDKVTVSTTGAFDSRDLTIVCANLSAASVVMILLYLRKLYWYSKMKRKDKLIRSRLQAANFPANFYGALHNRAAYATSWTSGSTENVTVPSSVHSAASSVRGSISSVTALTARNSHPGAANSSHHMDHRSEVNNRRKASTKKPFQDDDPMDDGTASCASSVQVQGEDLYPMEVYDVGSQFQPSSLFSTSNGKVYTCDN